MPGTVSGGVGGPEGVECYRPLPVAAVGVNPVHETFGGQVGQTVLFLPVRPGHPQPSAVFSQPLAWPTAEETTNSTMPNAPTKANAKDNHTNDSRPPCGEPPCSNICSPLKAVDAPALAAAFTLPYVLQSNYCYELVVKDTTSRCAFT